MARKSAGSAEARVEPAATRPRPKQPLQIDVHELEVAISATPQRDEVIEMFAYGAVGDAQQRGNVKQVDILAWIDLIVPMVKTIITNCPASKVQNTLQTVKARPNGLQARLLRMKLKNQVAGDDLTDQAKYELVKGVINKGVESLDDPEMWEGLYGRFSGWQPITEGPSEAAAPAEEDAAQAQPPAPPAAAPEPGPAA